MFEFLRQLVTGIQEAWRRLSVNARVQIGLSALLSVLLLGGAVFMGAQPQLTQAYSNLDLSEAATIEAWLQDSGTNYKLRGGGTIIDIQSDRVTATRVALAAQGIPKSQGIVPGFEIFDKPDMMSNKFLQDVDLARAYNGELQRQINMFEFVRNSMVFIHKADKSFFSSAQEPAEAVVTLDLVGGTPSKEQIKAIVHLISTYGGANLTRNGITITTTDAQILHSPVTDAFTALATDRLGNKVEIENQIKKKIESIFEGFGRRAIITLSADLDWSTEDTTSKTLGDSPISIATLTRETTTQTTESAAAQAPGVTGNLPEGSGEGSAVTSDTSDTETVKNNEVDETRKVTSLAPGRTRKYSITAAIEGDYAETGEGENLERTYVALTDDMIDNFTKLIAGSVGDGIETTEVFVMDLPFKVSAQTLAPLAVSASILTNPQFWQVIQGLFILMAFFMLRIFIRRAMVLPTVEDEEVIEMSTMSAEEIHAQDVADEVARLSREEPATVAALLRNWLAEDQ